MNPVSAVKNKYVVIVGCGRVGVDLAGSFSRSGASVVVIDRYESASKNLPSDFSGFFVEGDATEISILKQAKLDQADIVLVTTHYDNVNLMVAQIAKNVYGVSKVMARVFNPKRQQVFRRLGIDTVCPTCLASELMFNRTAAIHAS